MMLHKKDVLVDAEAKRVIAELYDKGHGLADYAIEQVLGKQLSKGEREDLIQEGFLRLIIRAETLCKKEEDKQLSYMYSVMRNVAIDEGRRRSKKKLLLCLNDNDWLEIPSTDLTPEERCMMEADIAEKRRRLTEVLERLEPRVRALLLEKYKNGLSDSEIGQKLGIKARNVRVYLARARRKAAMYYGDEVNEEKRNRKSKNQSDSRAGAERM